MRLIHVSTMLDFERGAEKWRSVDRSKEILRGFYGPALADKEYAILSHCWGVAERGEKEVSFQEMEQLVAVKKKRREIRRRTGYKKIIDTCKQARKDGLEWVWVDTCCIDKTSSSELSEAINSMYQWYANANQCYAYIHDATRDSWLYRDDKGIIHSSCRWFTRGWTLQEVVAPKIVHFFDTKWERIGDKTQLASDLSKLTRIPEHVLKWGLHSGRPSVAQIMSWAADRVTTREEDRAYSLLGLLGVHMPMLYGEGKNAFRRLQLEIIRSSNDQSIFAWGRERHTGWSDSFLADDPSCFRDCANVVSLSPSEFTRALLGDTIAKEVLDQIPAERLRTFTVTNDGIQIWLPTATLGPCAEVKLACSDHSRWNIYRSNDLKTMNLVLSESGCSRFFGGQIPKLGPMDFKQHFLPYKDALQNATAFTFELDCLTLPICGFVQCSIEPEGVEVKAGSVILSKDSDFAAITYVHKKHETYFSVILLYCYGRDIVFIISPSRPLEWQKVQLLRIHALERLFSRGWKDQLHHTEHAHLRRSIQHVRVITARRSRSAGCMVTVDVVRCPGCCLLQTNSGWKSLWVDGWNEDDRSLSIMKNYADALSTVKYAWLVDSSPATFVPTVAEIRVRLT
ncbi:heterokaryon incompatibility protein-domain-containing protein [Pisolithus thermaeus]|nr:heterokaryon incompatibility protein-domain-containing protein [Pisolithus thermaeus]